MVGGENSQRAACDFSIEIGLVSGVESLVLGVWPRAAAFRWPKVAAEMRCACGGPNLKHQTQNAKLQ
jgi:hypothetical protein